MTNDADSHPQNDDKSTDRKLTRAEQFIQARDRLFAEARTLQEQEHTIGRRRLTARPTNRQVIALVDDGVGLAEQEISLKASFPTACETGCDWCCYQRVSASPAEIVRIGLYLARTLSTEEQDALLTQLKTVDEQIRGKDSVERMSLRVACPMLQDGRCTIYYVRPMTCRGYTSNSAERCAAKLDDPTGEHQIIADPVRYLFSMAVLNGINHAVQGRGLEGGIVDLVSGLARLLTDPAEGDRWLAGVPVFADLQLPMEAVRWVES